MANWLFGEFDLLSDIEKNQIPTVGVGRDLTASRIRSLQVDNEAGGYAAAKHLYEFGHREIAVLRGPSELSDSDRRWQGIQRFAAEAGLSLASRRVAQLAPAVDPTSGFEEGFRLTAAMIGRGVKFTAVLAFDDLTAPGRNPRSVSGGTANPRRLLGHRLRRYTPSCVEYAGAHNHPPADGANGQPCSRVGARVPRRREVATCRSRAFIAPGHFALVAAGTGSSRVDCAEGPIGSGLVSCSDLSS